MIVQFLSLSLWSIFSFLLTFYWQSKLKKKSEKIGIQKCFLRKLSLEKSSLQFSSRTKKKHCFSLIDINNNKADFYWKVFFSLQFLCFENDNLIFAEYHRNDCEKKSYLSTKAEWRHNKDSQWKSVWNNADKSEEKTLWQFFHTRILAIIIIWWYTQLKTNKIDGEESKQQKSVENSSEDSLALWLPFPSQSENQKSNFKSVAFEMACS